MFASTGNSRGKYKDKKDLKQISGNYNHDRVLREFPEGPIHLCCCPICLVRTRYGWPVVLAQSTLLCEVAFLHIQVVWFWLHRLWMWEDILPAPCKVCSILQDMHSFVAKMLATH